MRRPYFALMIALYLLAGISSARDNQTQNVPVAVEEKPRWLPNSKLLGNVPGDPRRVNSFATSSAVSPDGKWIAFVHTGYGYAGNGDQQGITIVDARRGVIREYNESKLGEYAEQTFSFGVTFSADGKHLYVPFGSTTDPRGERKGSTGNGIGVYAFEPLAKISPVRLERIIPLASARLTEGKEALAASRQLHKGEQATFPAGLGTFTRNRAEKLLVAEMRSDTASILDVSSGTVEARIDLGQTKIAPTAFPYGALANKRGTRGYISLWNSSEVVEIDLEHNVLSRRIALRKSSVGTDAGSHPTAMALSADERWLYVTLGNSDELAVISLASGTPDYVSTATQEQKLPGATPTALALSQDGKTVYVANAASNSVAVFSADGGKLRPKGFLPTEWYPTALVVAGDNLYIASAKSQAPGPNGNEDSHSKWYIAAKVFGSIARIPTASITPHLAQWTDAVIQSQRYGASESRITFAGGGHPIRHVIYVLKENRTYDQVFGDIKGANGEPSLVMYGENITPNQHALARQFGILDNFYDSGEVSGNGHIWSSAGITTDYTEKLWPIHYRPGRQLNNDFQGTLTASVPLAKGYSDLAEPGTGYIWSNVARHGLTYRQYGEFIETSWKNDASRIRKGQKFPSTMSVHANEVSPYPWPVPMIKNTVPTKPELIGHYDPYYPSWSTDYPDQLRMDEFLREFEQWVAAYKKGENEQLPNLTMLWLPGDHTAGAKAGFQTPNAAVADNDLAVGRLVEAVSHSPYWEDTAILIIEDDAQNGQDHVDAHRSIALLVSKYAPGSTAHPYVESGFYTTVNMVRTIEDLLGLPPMNANDAWAPPIKELFTGEGDQPAFTADRRNQENGMIYEVNPVKGRLARESARLNLSQADAADTELLNRILWEVAMGARTMPKPKHNVILPTGEDD